MQVCRILSRRQNFAAGLRTFSDKAAASSNIYAGAFLDAEVVHNRVIDAIKTIKYAPEKIDMNSRFVADMGFDSILRKNLITVLEDEFAVKVPAAQSDDFVTVRNVVDYFSSHPKAR